MLIRKVLATYRKMRACFFSERSPMFSPNIYWYSSPSVIMNFGMNSVESVILIVLQRANVSINMEGRNIYCDTLMMLFSIMIQIVRVYLFRLASCKMKFIMMKQTPILRYSRLCISDGFTATSIKINTVSFESYFGARNSTGFIPQ